MKPKSGTVLILGLVAIFGIGWFSYRAFVPPQWLHDFAGEIAYRTAPDPNAPPPRDTREAKPPMQPAHPYICLAKLVPFAWDRMIVVPSSGDPTHAPALAGVDWPGGEAADYAVRMKKDPRYQLIAFIKDNRVIADAMFYTFWADLSSLAANTEGFTPDTAAFTAVVDKGTHILTPVAPLPAVCKGAS